MSEAGDRCANCGEVVADRGGVLVHMTGPQASKGTCALNPYGDFMATRGAGTCWCDGPDCGQTPCIEAI